MHVRKQVRGQEFPGLDALQPQVLSNAEMAHMEFDARRSVEHPYGLGYERIPLPHAYMAMCASGRVPFVDVIDPTIMSLSERAMLAENLESEKWDEGMYLDSYFDSDGEVAGVVRAEPLILKREFLPHTMGATTPKAMPPFTEQSQALLIQVLFAYLYEMHVSLNDASSESAWTICKLCRSIACFAEPWPQSNASSTMAEYVLHASYRRALTYPLYRSWALCAQVHKDLYSLLSKCDAKARILHVLRDMDAIFALAPTGTGVPEPMEIVLQLIWDVWFAPLEVWVQTLTPEDIRALASTILIPMSKADVGNPGDWDLDTLEWAAREAADEGEIGGYV